MRTAERYLPVTCDDAAVTPLTFAHRGGRDGSFLPNSIAAFADALQRGCQIETDLRLSADGQVVCAHDGFSRTGIRPIWVARMSTATLSRLGVATLEQLYRELGTSFEVSADLKVQAAAIPAIAVARKAGSVGRLWLVSDDPQALAAIRAAEREVRLIHETRHASLATEGISPAEHLDRLAAARIDAANTTVGDWTPALVDHAHQLGLLAFGSLLQTRTAMDRAVALGLDGFYSDHLERMRAAIESGS